MSITVKDLKDTFGGKGFGLYYLNSLSKRIKTFEVPEFEIIPIQTCRDYLQGIPVKKDIEAIISNLPDKKYAVRSGAAKSLPGLMDTILFVKKRDLEKEIIKVFKSFEKVPESMRNKLSGTAVIIQQMAPILPKTPKRVGVIFPKLRQNIIELVFKYNKKIGDDIVAGKKDSENTLLYSNTLEQTLSLNSLEHPPQVISTITLYLIFNKYVNDFGHPPELEIIQQRNPNRFYVLQIRDYKTTPEESKMWVKAFQEYNILPSRDLVKRMEKAKTYEIKEEPIFKCSGEGICTGVISKSNIKKDHIRYIEDGVSTKWINAIQSKSCVGIAFSKGSLHCHGVVLAKGEEKAYIKINEEIRKTIGRKKVTLVDGNIYQGKLKVKEGKKPKKIKTITPKLIKSKISYADIFSDDRAFKDVMEYKLAILGGIPQNELTLVLNRAATRFILWGFLSCIAEARHIRSAVLLASEYKNSLFTLFEGRENSEELKHSLVYGTSCGSHARTPIYRYIIRILKKGVTKIELLQTIKRMEDLFFNPTDTFKQVIGLANYTAKMQEKGLEVTTTTLRWEGSLGGPKWGEIAKATRKLIQALGKEISINKLLALLNIIENLQHNNAIFFNKFVQPSKIIRGYNVFNHSMEEFTKYLSQQGLKEYIKNTINYIEPDRKPIAEIK